MQKFINEINNSENFKYIFSSPFKNEDAKKVIYRKIIDGKIYWQEESFIGNQVFHSNIAVNEINTSLLETFKKYKQCCIQNKEETINAFNNNGKAVLKRTSCKNKEQYEHDKNKKRLIEEGDYLPILIELGVFNEQFKIVSSKFDKFKQINRFIEIIDDNFKDYNKKEINIIDFGCGKSYLTFVIYYYFAIHKKINTTITGYDLKEDVVEKCNFLAQKYEYKNLHFIKEDVANVKLEKPVDMLITLHACDTATDYALNFAINSNIKHIFSVPCCQHEVNSSIRELGELNLLLNDGIIKERFSALLTDSIRAEILRENGYKVELLEFVDLSHTPKNIMIRARKTTAKNADFAHLLTLQEKLKFRQKLLELQQN